MKLFVEIDAFRIAYERAGRGTPLVLLHGLLADSRLWSRQIADLATQFTIVAWDAPGNGESSDPPESFTFDDYADSLAGFMDALDLEPAHVLGLSWGGVVAQGLYGRHPDRVRSLILEAATAGWRGSLPEAVCEQRLASCIRESELAPEEWVHAWLPELLRNAPRRSCGTRWWSSCRTSTRPGTGPWPGCSPTRTLAPSWRESRCPPSSCGATTTGDLP